MLNNSGEIDITMILGIFFFVAIALLLGAVIFGSVATNVGNAITDNETKASFDQVDSMGAAGMSLLGTVALPVIIIVGFFIVLGWIKL